MSQTRLDNGLDKSAEYTELHSIDAEMVALAAGIEALSAAGKSGYARVLAAKLRAMLEAAMGPSAEVIPMAGRDPKR